MKTLQYYPVSSDGTLLENDECCIKTLRDAIGAIEFNLSDNKTALKKSDVVKGGNYWEREYIAYDDEFEYAEEVDGYFNGRVWFNLYGTKYTAKTREDRRMGGCGCKLVYVRKIK